MITLFLLSTVPVNAHDFNPGFITHRTCHKEVYREQYVAGTRESKGYVRSFTDRIEVPCNQMAQVYYHRHHRPTYSYSRTRYYEPSNSYSVSRTTTSTSSCNSARTTGGLLGGSLAAVLSEKDAYSWSIPLGAVVGMGIGGVDC